MASAVHPSTSDTETLTSPAKYYVAMSDDLGFLMARLNIQAVQTMQEMLHPLGLSARAYVVLRLAASDEPPFQRELAELLQLDPSQVVTIIHKLEAKGLVSRTQTATDRRTNRIVATEAGRALAKPAKTVIDATLHRIFAGVPEDELAAMRVMFLKLLTAGAASPEIAPAAADRATKGESVA